MAKEVSSPKSGSVYVACKLPHGLRLQLTTPMEGKENILGGGVNKFTINRRSGPVYKLNGVAIAYGERPKFTLTNGAAITKIPAAFWAEWLAQNETSDVVKNNLVFAHATEESTRAQARELKNEKSGFEPISTEVDSKGRAADPRMKGIRPVKKEDVEDEEALEES